MGSNKQTVKQTLPNRCPSESVELIHKLISLTLIIKIKNKKAQANR